MLALRLHRKAYKVICFVVLSLIIILCIIVGSANQNSDLSTTSQFKETFADLKNSFQQAGVNDYLKIPSTLVKWGSDKFVSSDSKDSADFIEDELNSDEDSVSAKKYGYDYGEQFKKMLKPSGRVCSPLFITYTLFLTTVIALNLSCCILQNQMEIWKNTSQKRNLPNLMGYWT